MLGFLFLRLKTNIKWNNAIKNIAENSTRIISKFSKLKCVLNFTNKDNTSSNRLKYQNFKTELNTKRINSRKNLKTCLGKKIPPIMMTANGIIISYIFSVICFF